VIGGTSGETQNGTGTEECGKESNKEIEAKFGGMTWNAINPERLPGPFIDDRIGMPRRSQREARGERETRFQTCCRLGAESLLRLWSAPITVGPLLLLDLRAIDLLTMDAGNSCFRSPHEQNVERYANCCIALTRRSSRPPAYAWL
jgi:hypothetical protein